MKKQYGIYLSCRTNDTCGDFNGNKWKSLDYYVHLWVYPKFPGFYIEIGREKMYGHSRKNFD
jgi:hypothetical protein